MATSRQIECADAPARPPVDAGGPLGPRHEHLGGDMSNSERECRDAGLAAASWALRHSRSHAQAADTLIGLLWELGLLPDPLCKWEPRTITDRWTGRRRSGGDAA